MHIRNGLMSSVGSGWLKLRLGDGSLLMKHNFSLVLPAKFLEVVIRLMKVFPYTLSTQSPNQLK